MSMTSKSFLDMVGLILTIQLLSNNPSHAQGESGSSNPYFGNSPSAVEAMKTMQTRADSAYADKRYDLAYKLYSMLTQVGDKFSAFRIATLYEDGLGVGQDMIEAYAWSYLATETGRQAFIDYHQQIKDKLNDDQLTHARKRAGELIRSYGKYAYAIEAQKRLRDVRFKCTGSRTGNTCSKVDASWLGCSVASEELPSLDCLYFGSLSLMSYNGMPLQLNQAMRDLREFIYDYSPGKVELGDLELIDDDKATARDQD